MQETFLDREKRHELIPAGSHTYSRGDESFPASAPELLVRARGPFTWDLYGHRFVDWAMAVRSVFLGHATRAVDKQVFATAKTGVNLSRPNPDEFQLAEKLLSAFPSANMVKFGKNGSDATAAAIRLARAATGREIVLRSSQAPFLGVHDWFIGSTEMSAGVPEQIQSLTAHFNYGDPADLEQKLRSSKGRVAAVILEPLGPWEPEKDYLHEVRRLTSEHGSVLIFDEIVSGFRLNFGGYQHIAGVSPDLTTLGKAMGNGYPISALLGSRALMELGGFEHDKERVFLMSSTYGPERSGLAAAIATLSILEKRIGYEKLEVSVRRLTNSLQAAFAEYGLASTVSFSGHPLSPNLTFLSPSGEESLSRKTLFMEGMAKRGVLLGAHLFSPSLAHGRNVVDYTIRQVREVLDESAKLLKSKDEDVVIENLAKVVKPVFRKYN